jgi:hypothetical protein
MNDCNANIKKVVVIQPPDNVAPIVCNSLSACTIINDILFNITSLSGDVININFELNNKLDLSGITITGVNDITVSGESPNFIIGYSGVSNNFFTTGTTLNNNILSFDRNDLSNAYSVDLSPLVFTGNTFDCNDLNNCDIITGITNNILSLSGEVATVKDDVIINENNIISLSGNINTINNILPNKLDLSGVTINGQQGITVSGSSPNFVIGYSGNTFDCNDLNNCDIITGITSNILSLSGNINTINNILPNKLDLSGVTITGVNDITVSGSSPNFIIGYSGVSLNTFVTGFTYSNNNLTISQNNGINFTASINSFSSITVNGVSTLNGSIISPTLSGTTDRLVEVNNSGLFSATKNIIQGYISSGSTEATLLSDVNNWDINGVYTGTSITNTFQGQRYYDSNYFFEAVDDNLWIRLIRG